MTSQLIVVSYPTTDAAERVTETARRLETEHLLDLEDLEYVSRDMDGTVRIHESINRPVAAAALGAFWGTFLGKCFGRPVLGAGLGAASGAALAGKFRNQGIDEAFVHELSSVLPPGSSAVFALVRRSTPDKVIAELGKVGGTVLHTGLSGEDEERLQAALDDTHRKESTPRSARSAQPTPRAHTRRVVPRRR